MIGRLFGTYNIHPVRYLACSDPDFELFENQLADNDTIHQFLKDHEGDDNKDWKKARKELTLRTRDHTNYARQFPSHIYGKVDYREKLSEEEQKKKYPELVLVTGYIQIEEYDHDDIKGRINLQYVDDILEEDANWTTLEQEKARNALRKIVLNRDGNHEIDSVRNISKEEYAIRFLYANPTKMAEETWTRIMFAWADKCTIIYHKYYKSDIDDFPIFGVHALDGEILVFNNDEAYTLNQKYKTENDEKEIAA